MAMSSLGKLPKHREIVHALTPLADRYFELGTQLELDYKQLKAIENGHKGNQSRCLIETIVLWQQNNTTDECSWSALAEAINRIGGYDKLVGELKKKDMADSKPQTSHYPPETERATNVGYLSVSDSTQSRPQRYDSRPSESEDESGYSSKSDSVQPGDSSGSEAECFELAPGCGCTDKKPCSLYTLCAGECPNPARKRVPVLRKKPAISTETEIPFVEENDFEEYKERTKELRKLFGIFLCETSHCFDMSKVDIQKLTLYIQGAYPVMKPRMEELSKPTNFEHFFRIIVDQACSWFDYGIIKDLILLFCTSAKSCLDKYEARFKKYAEQRLPKGMKHIEVGGGARKGGKQLVIKIDREWKEVNFSDLEKLRGTFASILGSGVRRSDLYLADIREGCIRMTFMITEELAGRLFPSRICLTSSQVQSLKDEGVLSVKCGSLSWRAAASNNKSDRARHQMMISDKEDNAKERLEEDKEDDEEGVDYDEGEGDDEEGTEPPPAAEEEPTEFIDDEEDAKESLEELNREYSTVTSSKSMIIRIKGSPGLVPSFLHFNDDTKEILEEMKKESLTGTWLRWIKHDRRIIRPPGLVFSFYAGRKKTNPRHPLIRKLQRRVENEEQYQMTSDLAKVPVLYKAAALRSHYALKDLMLQSSLKLAGVCVSDHEWSIEVTRQRNVTNYTDSCDHRRRGPVTMLMIDSTEILNIGTESLIVSCDVQPGQLNSSDHIQWLDKCPLYLLNIYEQVSSQGTIQYHAYGASCDLSVEVLLLNHICEKLGLHSLKS